MAARDIDCILVQFVQLISALSLPLPFLFLAIFTDIIENIATLIPSLYPVLFSVFLKTLKSVLDKTKRQSIGLAWGSYLGFANDSHESGTVYRALLTTGGGPWITQKANPNIAMHKLSDL